MKTRVLIFTVAIISMFFTTAAPALAQGGPNPIYVDPYRTDGNEDGSAESPYNSMDEGKAFAQAQPNGGRLFVKNSSGEWDYYGFINPVTPGVGGIPIPSFILYLLIAILAIILILIGWRFQRYSGQFISKE